MGTAGTVAPAQNARAAAWYGYADPDCCGDNDTELVTNCGNFQKKPWTPGHLNRLYPDFGPPNDGREHATFENFCASFEKSCIDVCDWQGAHHPCDEVSQRIRDPDAGRCYLWIFGDCRSDKTISAKDGSRIAYCLSRRALP